MNPEQKFPRATPSPHKKVGGWGILTKKIYHMVARVCNKEGKLDNITLNLHK